MKFKVTYNEGEWTFEHSSNVVLRKGEYLVIDGEVYKVKRVLHLADGNVDLNCSHISNDEKDLELGTYN